MAGSDLKIWVDADGCPAAVKEVVFRAAERLGIAVSLVANSSMATPRSQLLSLVIVPGGMDEADDHIVENVQAGDVVISGDVPLAARVVEKGAVVLDHRGQLLDQTNVRERLSARDFMEKARAAGLASGGPAAFSPQDKRRFAGALDRLLTKKLQDPPSA